MSADYPKVIQVGGVTVTVGSAEEEARWRASEAPSELAPPVPEEAPVEPFPDVLEDPDGVPPADPLDEIELDGAALNDGHAPDPVEPSKPAKRASKKK